MKQFSQRDLLLRVRGYAIEQVRMSEEALAEIGYPVKTAIIPRSERRNTTTYLSNNSEPLTDNEK